MPDWKILKPWRVYVSGRFSNSGLYCRHCWCREGKGLKLSSPKIDILSTQCPTLLPYDPSEVFTIFMCCPSINIISLGNQTLEAGKISLAIALIINSYEVHIEKYVTVRIFNGTSRISASHWPIHINKVFKICCFLETVIKTCNHNESLTQ